MKHDFGLDAKEERLELEHAMIMEALDSTQEGSPEREYMVKRCTFLAHEIGRIEAMKEIRDSLEEEATA